MALPKYYTPEAFTVIVRTAINKNPKLAECDPTSFLTALLTAAQVGIAPDGRNGHLIPRFNSKSSKMECTFQADYKGLVGLVRKNENVADIYAETVHESDTFKLSKGLHRDLVHEVDIRTPRGALIGAYAVLSYKDGTNSFEFMSRDEIDGIKSRSQSPNAGPWATDYSEMAKKTVIRRLLKLADLSQESADRLAAEVQPPDATREVHIAPAAVPPALPDAQPRVVDDVFEPEIPIQDPPSARRGRPPKKLLSSPEADLPDPEKPAEASKLDIIKEKLSALGKEPADLMEICLREKFVKPGVTLDEVPDSILTSLIEFWGEIEEEFSK